MPETAVLKRRIQDATASLSWKLKAQDAIDGESISEAKLENLLNEASKVLVGGFIQAPELEVSVSTLSGAHSLRSCSDGVVLSQLVWDRRSCVRSKRR